MTRNAHRATLLDLYSPHNTPELVSSTRAKLDRRVALDWVATLQLSLVDAGCECRLHLRPEGSVEFACTGRTGRSLLFVGSDLVDLQRSLKAAEERGEL